MKLILAIVHNDDSALVSSSLTKAGYYFTKIASTGGFLMSGKTTFIAGIEDDKVDDAIEIISKFSKKRMQAVSNDIASLAASNLDLGENMPFEVKVGSGTIFVLNIERFEKV